MLSTPNAKRDKDPLLVLSVQQPFATAIVHGPKDVENRMWEPIGVNRPFWLLIHAGKKPYSTDEFDAEEIADDVREMWARDVRDGRQRAHRPEMPPLHEQPRGAVVGLVRVVRVVPPAEALRTLPTFPEVSLYAGQPSPWIVPTQRFSWCIRTKVPFPEPIPLLGQKGLFEAPKEIVERSRDLFAAARKAAREAEQAGAK